MKSILNKIACVVLIILFALSSSTLLNRRSKLRRSAPIHNYYYRLYYGVITRLVPKTEKNLDQCLPPSWVNKNPTADEQKQFVDSLVGIQSVIGKLNVMLTKKVDTPCKEKGSLYAYVYRTVQIEQEKKAPAAATPVPAAPVTAPKTSLLETGVSRHKRTSHRSHSHRRHSSKKRDDSVLRPKISQVHPFDVIVEYFARIKETITGFFSLPLVKETLGFVKCIGEKFTHIKGVKDITTSAISKTSKFNQVQSVYQTLVDAICNWHKFRRSIHLLNAAFKQGNKLTRWQGFGYFVGRLISSIANN